uniref:Uncharacterized protein n=1 Tax=Arundo donax TaxID=35708 RepID=A0A0A9C366_ARUDO
MQILAFINASMSASGMICASFSRLNSSASISINIITKLKSASSRNECMGLRLISRSHTKPSTDTLATSGERQRLPNGHLPYVKVMLADVCSRPLWYKLFQPMPVVGNSALNLEVFIEPSSQCEQQCGLA